MDDETRDQICQAVSRILKERREELKLSMNEVAKRTNLSQQSISFVERGLRMPTLDTLLRICGALDVRLSEVIQQAESSSE